MKSKLQEALANHRGLIVLHDVEFGPAVQFWLVPFSASQLEEWWREQDSFDSNPDGILDDFFKALGETPPPHRTLERPGIFIDAENHSDGVALWMEMANSNKFYYCTFCCDMHAFLKRPDGALIYHRGYTGRRRDTLI